MSAPVPAWTPDAPVSPELARQLVAASFPQLADRAVTLLGVGWDNAAYRFGDDLVFRFAQRAFAAQFLENEATWLPRLAPHLPAPIPVPEFVGAPSPLHPYPFVGHRLVPGRTADGVRLADEALAGFAAPLGAFLRALHRLEISPDTRARAPGDAIARGNVAYRAPLLRDKLPSLSALVPAEALEAVAAELAAFADTPASPALPVWVHGDLYARHVLVGPDGAFAGVIDWGDVHLGDPAVDLGIAWTFLPREAHGAFLGAYGPVDDATWERARFRAFHYGVHLLHYGDSVGDRAMARTGRLALARALAPNWPEAAACATSRS